MHAVDLHVWCACVCVCVRMSVCCVYPFVRYTYSDVCASHLVDPLHVRLELWPMPVVVLHVVRQHCLHHQTATVPGLVSLGQTLSSASTIVQLLQRDYAWPG